MRWTVSGYGSAAGRRRCVAGSSIFAPLSRSCGPAEGAGRVDLRRLTLQWSCPSISLLWARDASVASKDKLAHRPHCPLPSTIVWVIDSICRPDLTRLAANSDSPPRLQSATFSLSIVSSSRSHHRTESAMASRIVPPVIAVVLGVGTGVYVFSELQPARPCRVGVLTPPPPACLRRTPPRIVQRVRSLPESFLIENVSINI